MKEKLESLFLSKNRHVTAVRSFNFASGFQVINLFSSFSANSSFVIISMPLVYLLHNVEFFQISQLKFNFNCPTKCDLCVTSKATT